MARTNTANHGFSRATDSSVDAFDFTLDHGALLDRLDAALHGIASFAAGGNLVNGAAGNAGKLLSAAGDATRGRLIGASAGQDAALIYQDNSGGTGADRYAAGYDDSANTFAVSYVGGGASLGDNGLGVDASGRPFGVGMLWRQVNGNHMDWVSAKEGSSLNTLHRYSRPNFTFPYAAPATFLKLNFGSVAGNYDVFCARIWFAFRGGNSGNGYRCGSRQVVFYLHAGVMGAGTVETVGTDSTLSSPSTPAFSTSVTQDPDTIAFQVQLGGSETGVGHIVVELMLAQWADTVTFSAS
ncbi:hypothetical protein FJZ36_16145 [Candidatus Poribacteria bacterium]|nr:hypothetical protein [Candidatus Poribacteria bacterium]